MNTLQLLTLVSSILVVVFVSPTTVADDSNCCTQLDIPSECHFLCGVGSQGFWTITRWKCTHKYFAKVATCKVSNKIDYVRLFGQELTQSIKDSFEKLSASLQAKLSSAKEFVKATVDELKQVPQDLLSSLKESLDGMTSSQFKGLVDRLTKFTAQNLKKFVSHVNLDAFFGNVDDVASKTWDREQLAALSQAAYRKFGDKVNKWSVQALRTLKQLLAGLSSDELAEMVGDVFKQGINYICMAEFDRDQKTALMVPAKQAYGDVSSWDDKVLSSLCKLLEALPVGDILKLASKSVTRAIDALAQNDFTFPQVKAIIGKLKEEWKDVKQWSTAQLQKVGKLMKGFDVEDLKSLLKDQFQAIKTVLGKLKLDLGQLRALAKKAIELLGTPDKWTSTTIKNLGNTVAGLLPSGLKQIGAQVVKSSTEFLRDADLALDQAQEIVEKIKTSTNLSQLNKADLLSLAKAVDGFVSSDIGQMTQTVVFSALPEMRPVMGVAMPILRQFIKKYEESQSSGKNVGMLGNFATALSRVEIDDQGVETIINNLDSLGLIPWDKTQVLTLAKKVREKWGDFNSTDADDSDDPNWGFVNMKRLGHIALGIAKEELRDLPIRGIEDVIDALGQEKDWSRGQIVAVLTRLREYWEMEELEFSNFTEVDVNSLGTFSRGLAQEELKKLPEKVLLIAIRRLGEQTDLPEDKLKARAYLAVELFKNQTGVDVLNASHIADLGSLVAGLNKETLRKITKEAFLENLYTIARAKGYDPKKLGEIARLAKQYFDESDVSKWIGDQWRDLGPAALGLDTGDLEKINLESLEEMLDELGTFEFSKLQAQALIKAVKNAWQETDVEKWTGEKLRRLGSLVKGLELSDLQKLGKQAFEDVIGTWGQFMDIDTDTLEALANKAKEHFADGDISKLTAHTVKRLGRVVLGLTPEDLDQLKLDNIDIIAALGKWREWSQDQLNRLKPKVQAFLKESQDDDLYMSLGQLGVSLSKDDIMKIPNSAFRLAVKQLSEIDGWSEEQLKAILDRAKTVWAQAVDKWDKDQVSELGHTLKALSVGDIGKLKTRVVDVIPPDILREMSVSQLKAFSPDQYMAMETPQVQAISSAKRQSLTQEQQDAIESVIANDPDEADPWGPDNDNNECPGGVCSSAEHLTIPITCLVVPSVGMWLL